jgi:predicted dehydrogenase
VSPAFRYRLWEDVTKLKLAVVGCGAIAEVIHLPVASASPDFRVAGLVDTRHEYAQGLASSYGVEWTASDYREAIGRVDAVLLAVPHHLHAPMAIEFLRAGIHVLVEKPMALCVRDCDRMIESAAASGSALAVGLVRRFFDSNRLVAAVVRSGLLGQARRVEMSEGDVYRWPMRSGFAFDPAQAGGGTLANLGIHTLDLLSWWFGEVEWVEYRDDAQGGVEAECQASLQFVAGPRAETLVSKLRDLASTYRLEFERGTLLVEDAGSEPCSRIRLIASGVEWEPVGAGRDSAKSPTRRDMFARQLRDFAQAIADKRDPLVSGWEGRRSVELLERCYSARRPLVHPWEEVAAAPPPSAAAQ